MKYESDIYDEMDRQIDFEQHYMSCYVTNSFNKHVRVWLRETTTCGCKLCEEILSHDENLVLG